MARFADGMDPLEPGVDTIDSREIIARIDYLESRQGEDSDDPLDQDEQIELARLRDLTEQAGGAPDWKYGEALISDDFFEDYARELADDIGAIKDDSQWPNSYIDWKAAAEALQMDYTSVEWGGQTYWIRS